MELFNLDDELLQHQIFYFAMLKLKVLVAQKMQLSDVRNNFISVKVHTHMDKLSKSVGVVNGFQVNLTPEARFIVEKLLRKAKSIKEQA